MHTSTYLQPDIQYCLDAEEDDFGKLNDDENLWSVIKIIYVSFFLVKLLWQ